MRLEVKAEIQDGLAQCAGITEHECDQQTPETSVTVKEWMDRLELHMRESCLDQRWKLWIVHMQKFLERIEAFIQPIGRRWNEQGVPRTRAANPVLRATELPGLLARAPAGVK